MTKFNFFIYFFKRGTNWQQTRLKVGQSGFNVGSEWVQTGFKSGSEWVQSEFKVSSEWVRFSEPSRGKKRYLLVIVQSNLTR